MVPVFGALAAVLVLGEAFGLHHALGLGLVLLGIVLSERAVRRRGRYGRQCSSNRSMRS